jgi:hypothetical protein
VWGLLPPPPAEVWTAWGESVAPGDLRPWRDGGGGGEAAAAAAAACVCVCVRERECV